MTSLFALDGHCCLVTGGGRGIGREAARAFVGAGATVAVGDLDADLAKDTVRAIKVAGGRGAALALDVGAPASVEPAVAEAARACEGRLDVLVNNAGVNLVKPADAVTLEEWERTHAGAGRGVGGRRHPCERGGPDPRADGDGARASTIPPTAPRCWRARRSDGCWWSAPCSSSPRRGADGVTGHVLAVDGGWLAE